MSIVVQRGTPIFFEDKLIGLWTEDLVVQENNFLIKVFSPQAAKVLEPNDSVELAINSIHFQIGNCVNPETQEKFPALYVDTLNGLRYVKQFLPEDSVLKKLPR